MTTPPTDKDTRLKGSALRHVESELYSYWDTRRAIEARTADIISGGMGVDPARERVNTGAVWDPTAFRGSLLADDLRLRALRQIVDAIEAALERLPNPCVRLVELYYWQNLDAEQTCAALGIKRATFYRLRQGVQVAVAGRLGWVGDGE